MTPTEVATVTGAAASRSTRSVATLRTALEVIHGGVLPGMRPTR